MFVLERRANPSFTMAVASPILAAVGMIATGFFLFTALGKDPVEVFYLFFIKPLSTTYDIGELLLKTTPLLLCGLGLAMGFRANVWNIGAEGQLTMGAIAGGGVALWFGDSNSVFAMPLMLLAGVLGGMVWAAIPAFLRTRFNTNEILVTLMLVYIAQLALSWLVHGPWRDPEGQNYPQSRGFGDAETMSVLIDGTRVTWGIVYAVGLALISWVVSQKTIAGFRMQVAGIGARGRRLCRIFREAEYLDCTLGLRRHRRPCRHLRSCRSDRAAAADDFAGLWLCRDHRRLDRQTASDRSDFRFAVDGVALSRRRGGADGNEFAVRHHRIVPGAVAVLPAGRRFVHHVPAETSPPR